jgi:hypothetical protein
MHLLTPVRTRNKKPPPILGMADGETNMGPEIRNGYGAPLGRQAVILLMAASLAACSSRPREFAPTFAAAPADAAGFEADYQKCRVMVANGQRSGFGLRLASGGAGVAAGAGVGMAMAGGTYSTVAGAMAAASATLVLMPVVAVASAWGVAKRSKLKKEKAIKSATGLCLAEHGYQVAGWERAKDQKRIKPDRKGADEGAAPQAAVQ